MTKIWLEGLLRYTPIAFRPPTQKHLKMDGLNQKLTQVHGICITSTDLTCDWLRVFEVFVGYWSCPEDVATSAKNITDVQVLSIFTCTLCGWSPILSCDGLCSHTCTFYGACSCAVQPLCQLLQHRQ